MTTVSHIISSFEKYFEEHLVAFPIIKFGYTQYGPIKNGRIKNQHSDFEKNKEPALRILDLRASQH